MDLEHLTLNSIIEEEIPYELKLLAILYLIMSQEYPCRE